MSGSLRAIDLCCGAGGWACAARGTRVEIVLAVDRCSESCRTYALNHALTEVICEDLLHDDVRRKVARVAGDGLDIVLGAIPCEWLSRLRRIQGGVPHNEVRSQRVLLDATLDIVRCIMPRYWCLEDVPEVVNELPIMTPWQVIDALPWCGQRRKRAYIGVFPSPVVPGGLVTLGAHLRPGPYRIGKRSADRRLVTHGISNSTILGMGAGDSSYTVTGQASSRRDAELVVTDDSLPGGRRQLEWQEAASLQGFPADYVFYGSPSGVMRMIGQAIQIDLGRAILSEIVRDFQGTSPPIPRRVARTDIAPTIELHVAGVRA